MQPKPQKPTGKTDYITLGISYGTGIGTAIGAIYHNIPIGISLGICLGIVVGAILEYRNNRKKTGAAGGQPPVDNSGEPPEGSRWSKPGETRKATSLIWQFSGAMIAFIVLMLLSTFFLKTMSQPTVRVVLAILPAVPVLFILEAIYKAISMMDEMQRAIQLEALALSLGGAAMISLALGLLENAGVPRLNWSWQVLIMALLWIAGQIAARRRYQ